MLLFLSMKLLHHGQVILSRHAESLLLFLSSLLLFGYTAPPSIFSGDSGDMTVAAATFGYAHPPGYPLYSLLGYIWIHFILPIGSVAWRMNMFSAVCGAASVVVCFHIIKHLTRQPIAAAVGALSLATSYAFWEFSIVAEVFSLHVLLSLLLLYWVIRWFSEKSVRYLYCAAFTFSLAIAHQHMIVLWIPGLLYLVCVAKFWQRLSARQMGIISALVLSGFLWYLYLPLSMYLSGQYYWGDGSTLSGIVSIFLREAYGTFDIVPGGSPLALGQRLNYLPVYGLFVLYNFGVVGAAMAVLGVLHAFKTSLHVGIALVVNFFISGLGFLLFAGINFGGIFFMAMLEKFAVMSLSLVAVFIGLGVAYILSFLGTRRLLLHAFMVLVLGVLPLYQLITHWPLLNLHGYWEGYYLGLDTLSSLDRNAIIVLDTDTSVFNTRYVHVVEGVRYKDVIINAAPRELTARAFAEKVAPKIESDIEPNDPLFIKMLFDTYPDVYSFYLRGKVAVDEGWVPVPEGMLYKQYRVEDLPSREEQINKIQWFLDNSFMMRYVDTNVPVPAYARDVRHEFGGALMRMGEHLLYLDELEKAEELFHAALRYDPFNGSAKIGLSSIARVRGECEQALAIMDELVGTRTQLIRSEVQEYQYIYQFCLEDAERAAEYEAQLQ